jgi:hypothetical protein
MRLARRWESSVRLLLDVLVDCEGWATTATVCVDGIASRNRGSAQSMPRCTPHTLLAVGLPGFLFLSVSLENPHNVAGVFLSITFWLWGHLDER